MLSRALAADAEIPESRRRRWRANLWWFGPAAGPVSAAGWGCVVLAAAPLLLVVAGCSGRFDQICIYIAAQTPENPTPEPQPYPWCAEIGPAGRPVFAPRHLEAASYNEGLTSMLVAGDWYYVRPDGSSLRVITFDNGPDSWADGLVRSRREDKIAYSNRAFAEVIPPRYDWGWPFEEGRALVCSGCRAAEPTGEHRPIVGGNWGYIDRSGNEVVAVRHSRDEARELGREISRVPASSMIIPPPGGDP